MPLHTTEEGEEIARLRAEVERLRGSQAKHIEEIRKLAGHAGTSCEMLAQRLVSAEADNERLKALIAEAEWAEDFMCPWCHGDKDDRHYDNCPAFSARGEVRR